MNKIVEKIVYSPLNAPVDLQFTQSGRVVTLKVPNLKYWTMVVFE